MNLLLCNQCSSGKLSFHPSGPLNWSWKLLLLSPLWPDASGQQQPSSVGAQSHSGASDPGPIRATAPMWRCSRIMHMQRELHPTLLSSLEGIVDQMVWFRENWHEEVRKWECTLFVCVRLYHFFVLYGRSEGEKDKSQSSLVLLYVWKRMVLF